MKMGVKKLPIPLEFSIHHPRINSCLFKILLNYGECFMNDKWTIYQDDKGEWRWTRTASNGRIVGASTEGYTSRINCLQNAQRNGYTGS